MGSGELVLGAMVGLFVLACAILAIQAVAAAREAKRKRNRKEWTTGHTRQAARAKVKSAKARK